MVDSYHLTIDLPQSVKTILLDAEQEVKHFLALKMYQKGSVSIGYAAEIAEMDRVSFEFLLADNKIPISNPALEQVMADADSIDRLGHSACW
jgi:predicted HTH domain antitoxin